MNRDSLRRGEESREDQEEIIFDFLPFDTLLLILRYMREG